jgi:hypothetical protein
LKAFARFVHDVGYSGLLVSIDEAVNLYKITNSVSRNNNYEQVLKIVNDCLQGRAGYIGFLIGGTPEFMDDERRGLFSYEALRTRLSSRRFEQDGLRDMTSPVLRLPPLAPEEIFVLLGKLRDIHRDHVPNSRPLDDSAIQAFMHEELRRIGASQFTTPRELVRDFIQLSNLLAQHPDRNWVDLLGAMPIETIRDPHAGDSESDFATQPPKPTEQLQPDPFDRFADFKV